MTKLVILAGQRQLGQKQLLPGPAALMHCYNCGLADPLWPALTNGKCPWTSPLQPVIQYFQLTPFALFFQAERRKGEDKDVLLNV